MSLIYYLLYPLRKSRMYGKGMILGRYPQNLSYRRLLRKSKKLDSFNEKIFYRMAKDRSPTLKIFGDKLQTREYLVKLGLEGLLPKLFWSGTDLKELREVLHDFEEFVLKPSKGSGAILICSDKVPYESLRSFNHTKNPWGVFLYKHLGSDCRPAIELAKNWLRTDYSKRPDSYPEWAYSGGPNRLVLEEVLLDCYAELPKDYKLFIFGGRCKLIQVDYGRYSKHTRAYYSENWERLNLTCVYPQHPVDENAPQELQDLIRYSEQIGKEVDFVRVDLYITSLGIKLGECTIYPGGGVDLFKPANLNKEIAKHWTQNY